MTNHDYLSKEICIDVYFHDPEARKNREFFVYSTTDSCTTEHGKPSANLRTYLVPYLTLEDLLAYLPFAVIIEPNGWFRLGEHIHHDKAALVYRYLMREVFTDKKPRMDTATFKLFRQLLNA